MTDTWELHTAWGRWLHENHVRREAAASKPEQAPATSMGVNDGRPRTVAAPARTPTHRLARRAGK